jgi:hypothetical protein
MRSAYSMALVRVVLPLLLVPALGCSSDKDRVEKQLSKLREEVVHLQSETDRMGDRLDAMEMRQAAVPHYAEERVAQNSPTLSRPKLKVVRVEPGNDGSALDPEGTDATAADADTGPRLLIQGEGKSLESRTLPGSAVAPKTTKAEAPKAKSDGLKSSKAESRKSDGAKADKADGPKATKSEAAPAK